MRPCSSHVYQVADRPARGGQHPRGASPCCGAGRPVPGRQPQARGEPGSFSGTPTAARVAGSGSRSYAHTLSGIANTSMEPRTARPVRDYSYCGRQSISHPGSLRRGVHWLNEGVTKVSERFGGKNVVVIGGNSGIGLAAARAFAQEGARVVITGPSTADPANCGAGDRA